MKVANYKWTGETKQGQGSEHWVSGVQFGMGKSEEASLGG